MIAGSQSVKMVVIQSIKARQIFDSRGNPTVEVDLRTEKGRYNTDIDQMQCIILLVQGARVLPKIYSDNSIDFATWILTIF